MQVTLLAIGTWGDVHPVVALGAALQRTGRHTARLVAPDDFMALAQGAGLDFRPFGLRVRDLLRSPALRPFIAPGGLQELCDHVAAEKQVVATPGIMSRELARLKLPRKKEPSRQSTRHAAGPARPATFVELTETRLNPVLEKLKFLDESGANLGLTRLYGRAAPGERVVESTPGHSGPHYTIVAALSLTGISAPWVFEGSMTSLRFRAYVEQALGPSLEPGDIVILDNLAAHKDAEARTWIEARGAYLIHLPSYSPDLNPIELCWATVKNALRTAKARSFDALVEALREALLAITPAQADGGFAHCGYYPA